MPHRTRADQDVTVLLPLRSGGKVRLAAHLSEDQRWRLALAMLDGVVEAVRGAGVSDIRVLADGAAAIDAADARGLPVLADRDTTPAPTVRSGDAGRLRRAVDDGLAACDATHVRAVIAADLPLLKAEDVAALLDTADRVTIAPTRDGGTGAILLPADCTLATRYGRGSATAHFEAARTAGQETVRLDRTGFAVDLDAAADLTTIIAIARMGTVPGGTRCGQAMTDALLELGLLVAAPTAARV
jgi:2-phospho-L-lactate/phosphoenolpyruvate guanylyltransferase